MNKEAEHRDIVCNKCGKSVGEYYQTHICCPEHDPFVEAESIYSQEELDTYAELKVKESNKKLLEELKKEIDNKTDSIGLSSVNYDDKFGLRIASRIISQKIKEL